MKDAPDGSQESANDEREDEDDEPEERSKESEIVQEAVGRPRAHRATPPVLVTPFGAVPVMAHLWNIQRLLLGGNWVEQTHPDGVGVRAHAWPITELSTETVRERWGAGTFRVGWYTATAQGGRKFICKSQPLTLDEVRPAPAVAVAAMPSSGMPGVDDALRFMGVIDSRADAKLDGMVKLMTLFGASQGGMRAEDLRAILRDEREHAAKTTADAIKAAVEPLQKQIAELSEDDDDDDSPITDAARAAVKPLFKGKSTWWKEIGNFVAEHPDGVKAVAPVVLGAVTSVAGAVAAAVAAQPKTQPVVTTTRPTAQRPTVVQTTPPPSPTPPAPVLAEVPSGVAPPPTAPEAATAAAE